MKQVRETKAGLSISAYVVLKKGKPVATVNAHFSNAGTCTVDVWAIGHELQQGKAGGYGYDKFASALSGMVIDGVTLTDHCGKDSKSQRILKNYLKGTINQEQADKLAKKAGARFANHSKETGKYSSLHILAGLDRLELMGYTVITAI